VESVVVAEQRNMEHHLTRKKVTLMNVKKIKTLLHFIIKIPEKVFYIILLKGRIKNFYFI
jgi:hypothetical protein